ncbi:endonuclease/exonuclease/phosphatase family protein [Paenibacillus sp. FSL K6-1230]|uniref:endonuclease/exonuclease/phosphatase family protein n=1 Tax=Paenibacillus sp. FSL K6-1230 TaxID=2921603 RepID=UPI0030FABD1E
MNILTLNAHAWMEENQSNKIAQLANFIHEQDFDIVALQEVNQSRHEAPLGDAALSRFHATSGRPVIKADNYAYNLCKQIGREYYWTYVPVHVGFDKFDEGLAILTKMPIVDSFEAYVSEQRDYDNYRTRKILGIQTKGAGERIWFINGHFGWWHDGDSFKGQWDRFLELSERIIQGQAAFMMGDFNNAAHLHGEGYDYVIQSGWHDCYTLAKEKDEGHTVVKEIAGWEDNKQQLRIDYVFSNRELSIHSSKVVLDGKDSPIVSDHFGIAVTL